MATNRDGRALPLDIILFGLLAAFLVFQLWSVLGRRTGHEEEPREPLRRDKQEKSGDDNTIPFPSRASGNQEEGSTTFTRSSGNYSGALAQALTDIELADRTFLPDEFLSGAQGAYEIIVTSFANGDKATLKSLLSDDVYDQFDQAISAREDAGQIVESSFVGLRSADITSANLSGSTAEVTVKFVSELISVTKDADGAVIEGDPNQVREVRDIWTFAREVNSRDPNWVLIATGADDSI